VEEIVDFPAIQAGAFDAQFVDGFGEVGESPEFDADGRAAARGLRASGGAQIFDGFAGVGEMRASSALPCGLET